MNVKDLRALCEEREYVQLHLPPPNGRGYWRKLCGRHGPRGEIISGSPERGQIVEFRSQQILRYLDKMKARGSE